MEMYHLKILEFIHQISVCTLHAKCKRHSFTSSTAEAFWQSHYYVFHRVCSVASHLKFVGKYNPTTMYYTTHLSDRLHKY